MIPYPNNGRWSVRIVYEPIVFREGPYYLDEIGCIRFKKFKSRNLIIPPTRLTTFKLNRIDP